MDANLMHAARAGSRRKQRKSFAVAFKSLQHAKFGPRCRAIRMNALFEPDPKRPARTFAQDGRVDLALLPIRPAEDDGAIFLCHRTVFDLTRKPPRRVRVCGDQEHAAGLAIESVDERDLS